MEKQSRFELGPESIESGLEQITKLGIKLLEINEYEPIAIGGVHISEPERNGVCVSLSRYFKHADGDGYDSYHFNMKSSRPNPETGKRSMYHSLKMIHTIRPARIYSETDLSSDESLVHSHMREALATLQAALWQISEE